MTKKNLVFLK